MPTRELRTVPARLHIPELYYAILGIPPKQRCQPSPVMRECHCCYVELSCLLLVICVAYVKPSYKSTSAAAIQRHFLARITRCNDAAVCRKCDGSHHAGIVDAGQSSARQRIYQQYRNLPGIFLRRVPARCYDRKHLIIGRQSQPLAVLINPDEGCHMARRDVQDADIPIRDSAKRYPFPIPETDRVPTQRGNLARPYEPTGARIP
jgi:hypothetical protein